MVQSLIVFPLRKELNYFTTHLQYLGLETINQTVNETQLKFCPQINSLLAATGIGKKNYYDNSLKILSGLKGDISQFICAGSAGSISKDLKAFDIIIAESCIAHDEVIQKEKPTYLIDKELINKFSNKTNYDFKVVTGEIASGDETISSDKKVGEIKKISPNIKAVSWEGAAGAQLCENKNIPYIEIRSITDQANSVTLEDFKKNLDPAIKNLTLFLVDHLKN